MSYIDFLIFILTQTWIGALIGLIFFMIGLTAILESKKN